MEVMAQRLTQKPPSARKVRADVSEHADALLRRMMATEREDRYTTYEDFLADLDRVSRLVKARTMTGGAPPPGRAGTPPGLLPDETTLKLRDSGVVRAREHAAAQAADRTPAPAEEAVEPEAPAEPPRHPGGWSVLSTDMQKTSNLDFEALLDLIARGEIHRYTTIAGPSTNFRYTAAEETPMVSKHLGVCFHCKRPVRPVDVRCPFCKTLLDQLLSKFVERASVNPKDRALRAARRAGIVTGLLLFVFLCTNWWQAVTWGRVEQAISDAQSAVWQAILRPMGIRVTLPQEKDTPPEPPDRAPKPSASRP
jgi:hypothetical protein